MHRMKLIGLGAVMGCLLVAGCGSESPSTGKVQQDATQQQSDVQTEAAPSEQPDDSFVRVLISTNKGDIELALNEEKAPISVANFLAYVDNGHFAGTVFHRVIAGFMIQGGGFTESYDQKPVSAPIENEATNGLKNVKYSIAMARTNAVNSATAQFFINVADNAFLDHSSQSFGYAVFGQVVSGESVVDDIAAVQTGANGRFRSDVPIEPIVIQSVSRL